MIESAGIVLFRRSGNSVGEDPEPAIEILLVHPGGPFWAKKDTHGWSIPKGEFDPDDEAAEAAAFREFAEELGQPVPTSQAVALPSFRAGRKRITAWLVEGEIDASQIESNTFEMEWPPKSGQLQSFPEVDRAAWFSLQDAATKLHKGQLPIIPLIAAAID